MKPQDIIFLAVFLFSIFKNNPKFPAISGLICLIASIPLFSFWIFFTAERLVMYAAAFFLLSTIFYIIDLKKQK